MSGSRAKLVRAYLRETGGATAVEIAAAMGISHTTLNGKDGVLASMPDIYIDRWETKRNSQGRLFHTAVWCVVDVPPHCPRPENFSERRKNKQRKNSRRVASVSLDQRDKVTAT